VLEARRLLDGGALGQVYTIICEDCFIMGLQPAGSLPGTPGWTAVGPGSWRADLKQMGGGELIDTGYHPSYRLLFLASAEPRQISAVTATYRNKHMQAEDTATVLIGFDNGITGLVRTSWAMELPRGHYPFHVVGEKGELYGTANELNFRPCRFQEPAKITLPEMNTFEAEVIHFVTCIETGEPPVQTYRDGIRVLKMIRRAYDSVEAQRSGG
jgi:predicted dehydrogenase